MKFVLKKSIWRCGWDSPDVANRLGDIDDPTLLLDPETGRMCCMGQLALQCGVHEDRLGGRTGWGILEEKTFEGLVSILPVYGHDIAVKINDDLDTTVEEKIEKLTKLLAKHDIEMEVVE